MTTAMTATTPTHVAEARRLAATGLSHAAVARANLTTPQGQGGQP
jgi:hypothetical protein